MQHFFTWVASSDGIETSANFDPGTSPGFISLTEELSKTSNTCIANSNGMETSAFSVPGNSPLFSSFTESVWNKLDV